MSGSRRGKRFEAEFARSLRSFGKANPHFWWARWPDHRDWIAVNRKLRAPRAPCDFVAVWFGRLQMFELKSSRGTRFRFDWLKDHQRQSLFQLQEAGAEVYLVFSKRGRPVRCWAIRLDDYLSVEARFQGAGYKSVPVEALAQVGLELPRLRDSFNLGPLFQGEG